MEITLKPRIGIFVDGMDGVGKTTVTKLISEKYEDKLKLVIQPNGNGILGFLRSIVKSKDIDITPTFRQTLHVMSHILDYSNPHLSDFSIIFDRSPLSNYIYSQLESVPQNEIDIMMKVQFEVLKANFSKLIFIILVHDMPLGFKGEKDDSYYEKKINISKLSDYYKTESEIIVDKYCDNFIWGFYQINVTGLSIPEVFEKVESVIEL